MEWLTLEEASGRSELAPSTLRRLCAERKIEGAVKKGKTWLVPERSVAVTHRQRRPKLAKQYPSDCSGDAVPQVILARLPAGDEGAKQSSN